MIFNNWIEDTFEPIANFIACLFFLAGIFISLKLYQKKKTTTHILLLILMIVGVLYSIGEILEAFTSTVEADEFTDFFTVFFSVIILIIVLTSIFEYKIMESEQKLYEQKIKEKLNKEQIEKLKEIDQIRSDFVRRTSHELKTPLISIYTSSQYILDSHREDLNEEILKLIEVINRGGNKLKKLTENLLLAYDLESNRFILNKQKENLTEIVKECAKDMESFLMERELFLKLDLDIINEISIDIDKPKVEQVILNLLSNAIKNTPIKGIIYIGLKKTSNSVDIIIKDTGIGFTEAEKEKAFKKFGKINRQIKNRDIITEGSGLGLYITQEIVDLHNGKIWLESEGRDKGSTFIVRLPIEEA